MSDDSKRYQRAHDVAQALRFNDSQEDWDAVKSAAFRALEDQWREDRGRIDTVEAQLVTLLARPVVVMKAGGSDVLGYASDRAHLDTIAALEAKVAELRIELAASEAAGRTISNDRKRVAVERNELRVKVARVEALCDECFVAQHVPVPVLRAALAAPTPSGEGEPSANWSCPFCGCTHGATERRLNGNTACGDCGRKAPTAHWDTGEGESDG